MNDFGLTQSQSLTLKETLTRVLGAASPFTISIFGSRARGDHRPYSDIDLLVEGSYPQWSALERALETELEEGPLPFKVDLVHVQELHKPYAERVLGEKKLFLLVG